VINTLRNPKGIKVEAELMKESSCQWKLDWLIAWSFYPYHFVRTILTNTMLS